VIVHLPDAPLPVHIVPPPAEPPALAENVFGSATQSDHTLRGEVYALPEGTQHLPDFDQLMPLGTLYAQRIDIAPRSFSTGFPGVPDRVEWFGLRYTGDFVVETEGTYGFRLVADDGARLRIDGQLVIDNDGVHPPRAVTGAHTLSPGRHHLVLEYFQGPRFEIALQLFWTPPQQSERIFSL